MPPSMAISSTKHLKRTRSQYENVTDLDEVAFDTDHKRSRHESDDVKSDLSSGGDSVNKHCADVVDEDVDDREKNRRSPNGYLLPDPLPKGEVLIDQCKQKWSLGKTIGLGGFGEIYLASKLKENGQLSQEQYVIKVEPHHNGPLFCEIHFYLRAAKEADINEYMTLKGLKHLGVPRFVGSGSHVRQGQKYRFLVMPRFGTDLQRILDHLDGRKFTTKTVCSIGIQVLDSLEYIHSRGYVHKDIKALNLLVGRGPGGQHQVHLVDYGLCSKFRVGGLHKQFVHDMRFAHEGTLEYTSREAHIGCAGRRGDLEGLVYNLVEWMGGVLPWGRDQTTVEETELSKFIAFDDINGFMNTVFNGEKYPEVLKVFMNYIKYMEFEANPNYKYLRNLLKKEIVKDGGELDGKLEFKLVMNPTSSDIPQHLRLKKLEKHEPEVFYKRFEKLAVPEKTWQKLRDNNWNSVCEKSLENPTPAMKNIMDKMTRVNQVKAAKSPSRVKTPKTPKFSLTPCYYTPAMEEVMSLRKLQKSSSDNPSILPMPYLLNLSLTIPPDVVSGDRPPSRGSTGESPPPSPDSQSENGEDVFDNVKPPVIKLKKPPKRKLDMSKKDKRSTNSRENKELRRLQPFLETPRKSIRVRSRKNSIHNMKLGKRGLGFQSNFGNVRSLMRRVLETVFQMDMQ